MSINQRELAAFLLVTVALVCIVNACRAPGRFISDEEMRYNQSSYDACLDSIDESECEDNDTMLAKYN